MGAENLAPNSLDRVKTTHVILRFGNGRGALSGVRNLLGCKAYRIYIIQDGKRTEQIKFPLRSVRHRIHNNQHRGS